MKRRDFMQLLGTASAAAAVMSLVPVVSSAAESGTAPCSAAQSRYMIHGNKKLGCSGFDFPDDPAIIDNGLFMPRM
jgi:hypothetical protein